MPLNLVALVIILTHMPIKIIATKLYPPTVGHLVPRPLLLKRLQEGICGKVTILCAPPGFGKSTLLAAWLAAGQTDKVAWYSLDEDDNDVARFFGYIAASMRSHEIASFPMLDSLLETVNPNPRELTAALINDLSEIVDKNIVLVLDDYHQITSQPIHDALVYLIDHLPPNLHLVFISRVDPPLPLGRYRVRGQLTEIRAEDLRFNEDEAAQFLNQIMGLALSAEEIRTLGERTEGWVAALQLAAVSLQRSSNPGEVISQFAGSHRYIAEYLTDEVLAQQSESLRYFLMQTSILERFNAPLCNAVLGSDNAEFILMELVRANLFIIPLDSKSYWFRYHHLFADLMRRKLEQADQKQVENLHRRAAEWFEKNDFLLDAIRHRLAANQPDRVAELVERAIGETWGRAEQASFVKHIESLPESVLAEHPSLSAFLGWSWIWLGQDSERILHLLDRAEQNSKEDLPSLGRLNVVRSTILRISQNNSVESLRLAKLALAQLSPNDSLWHSFAQLETAIATHATGKPLAEAEKTYSETIRLCEQAGDRVTAWIAACARVQVASESGDLGRAFTLNRQLLDALWKGSPSLVHGWARINQATLLYQVNDLEAARREVDLTLELVRQSGGIPDVSMRLYALLTKLEWVDGKESLARKAAEDFIALAKHSGAANAMDWAHAVRAELAYKQADWPAFDAWARAYQPPQQPLFFPYRLATRMYARHLIRQKDWDKSRHLLDEQTRLAKEAGHIEFEMELDLARAILEKEAGRASESMQALQRALTIGAAGGYLRVFIDEGDAVKTLLSQAQKQTKDETLRAYIAKLLLAFNAPAALGPSALIEPLTGREIEVLRLVADGMSNPEIASKLFLSVGTVKTHVKHIYGKLAVDDRVKAASRARELGIIN